MPIACPKALAPRASKNLLIIIGNYLQSRIQEGHRGRSEQTASFRSSTAAHSMGSPPVLRQLVNYNTDCFGPGPIRRRATSRNGRARDFVLRRFEPEPVGILAKTLQIAF